MFEEVSAGATTRLVEVQRLLGFVQRLEDTAKADKNVVSIATALKGLFFVNLYGAFEYSVTQNVQLLLQEMSKFQLPHAECQHLLHSVSLDAAFNSLSDSGPGKKWFKRAELLMRQTSDESWKLNDTVFQDYLQNIWYETLEILFRCLSINDDPVPENSIRGYIDEVVEKRNAVAHGRSSPTEIGRLKTVTELQDALNAITSTTNHITKSFDTYLLSRAFVLSDHRHKYAPHP